MHRAPHESLYAAVTVPPQTQHTAPPVTLLTIPPNTPYTASAERKLISSIQDEAKTVLHENLSPQAPSHHSNLVRHLRGSFNERPPQASRPPPGYLHAHHTHEVATCDATNDNALRTETAGASFSAQISTPRASTASGSPAYVNASAEEELSLVASWRSSLNTSTSFVPQQPSTASDSAHATTAGVTSAFFDKDTHAKGSRQGEAALLLRLHGVQVRLG